MDTASEPVTPPEPKRLTYEDILAAEDITTEVVDVPEWGGTVLIRRFSKAVELQMRGEAKDEQGKVDGEKLEMLMLVHGVVDPILTADMASSLMLKSASAVDRILTAVVTLNNAGGKAIEQAIAGFQEGPGEKAALQAGEGPAAAGEGTGS